MTYFIYKLIHITGIGGVSIPNIEGVNGGLGSYGEWLLGTADDIKKLKLIKEFGPIIITESIFLGIPLIGKAQIVDGDNLRDLTSTEITNKNAAEVWEARIAAYEKLGTIEDQLDMIYWDKINKTTIWQDAITEIKTKNPKK
jgi:hypothetical protein